MKIKMISLVAAVALSACLFAAAAAATGAYFSDVNPGTVTGTAGTISVAAGVNADFGGGLAINWPNILPGEVQSAVVHYKNDGTAPQDVWVTFPVPAAVAAINDLGGYGAIQIIDSNTGSVFYSNNLNAGTDQGSPGPSGQGPMYMLKDVKLCSNLPVGAEGTMTFKFQYAPKLQSGNFTGFPFNPYPLGTPTMSGLPYAIVGTQVGIVPGATGGYAGF
jgi:hypothetical protein